MRLTPEREDEIRRNLKNLAIEQLLSEIDALRTEGFRLQDIVEKQTGSILNLEAEIDALKVQSDEDIAQISKNYQALHHDLATTCGYYNEALKERDDLKAENERLSQIIQTCYPPEKIAMLTFYNNENQKLRAELDEAQKERDKLKEENQKLKARMDKLEQAVSAADDIVTHYKIVAESGGGALGARVKIYHDKREALYQDDVSKDRTSGAVDAYSEWEDQ